MEMSHSGLVRLPAKEVGVEAPREFESPHLRQSEEPRCAAVHRGLVVGVACWRGTGVSERVGPPRARCCGHAPPTEPHESSPLGAFASGRSGCLCVAPR